MFHLMAYCREHFEVKIFTYPAKILFTATVWDTWNLSRKICRRYFCRCYYLQYTSERNTHFWNILCACGWTYSVLFCDHAGFNVHLLQHQSFITKLITLVISNFTELNIIFVFLKFMPHKNFIKTSGESNWFIVQDINYTFGSYIALL